MLDNLMINILGERVDKEFFQRMCAEQVKLPELKRFIAVKQLGKLNDQIGQRLSEIKQTLNIYMKQANDGEVEDSSQMLQKLDEIMEEMVKLESMNKELKTVDITNMNGYIAIVDSCNIALNGEENCDIIIGKATADELQIYIYQLMKQFEKENGPIEFGPQKRI